MHAVLERERVQAPLFSLPPLETLRTDVRPPHGTTIVPAPRRSRDRVAPWARAMFAAWVLLLGAITLTEPPPEPDPHLFLWVAATIPLFLLALPPALMLLFVGRRAGLGLSAVAAGAGTVIAVGCLMGHHAVGPWSISQLVGFTSLAGASAVGWVRTRRA